MNFNHINPPNTTLIPNEFLDYFIKHLSSEEFNVLMAICRKTFSIDKKNMTCREFYQIVPMPPEEVGSILLNLVENELIKKTNENPQMEEDKIFPYDVCFETRFEKNIYANIQFLNSLKDVDFIRNGYAKVFAGSFSFILKFSVSSYEFEYKDFEFIPKVKNALINIKKQLSDQDNKQTER